MSTVLTCAQTLPAGMRIRTVTTKMLNLSRITNLLERMSLCSTLAEDASPNGLLLLCRQGLRPRIIPALGSDYEFRVALDLGLDADRPETAAGPGVRWLIADGVLIADIVGDLPADLTHLVERGGEKGKAAGP